MFNASSENNLSTTIRTLCLESPGISEQTLANYSGGVLLITSVDTGIDSVSELEYFSSVENIEISLYAHARHSLLLLNQGNIHNRLRFLNKYLVF